MANRSIPGWRLGLRIGGIKENIVFFLLFASLSSISLCQSLPTLDRFNAAAKELVLRYYPNAAFTQTDSTLKFEFDAMDFCVHSSTLTGDWQEARKIRGPRNRNGIYAEMFLIGGRPQPSQACLMATDFGLTQFDRFYFCTGVLDPYSEKNDCHLSVSVMYPKEIPEQFLKEFKNLVEHFEDFL